MNLIIPIGKHQLQINCKVFFRRMEGVEVIGIGNKVDNRFCVFLDYDYDEEETLFKEIKGLQRNYELGNAYLFKTTKGYHVIFIDLVNYEELKIILDASTCDYSYKMWGRRNQKRQWVLRISPKNDNEVLYHSVIHSPQRRFVSPAHLDFLIKRGVPEHHFFGLEQWCDSDDLELTFVRYDA